MIDIDQSIIGDYVTLASEMTHDDYLRLYESIKARYPKVFDASECAFEGSLRADGCYEFEEIGKALAIHSHNLASILYMLEKAQKYN